MRKMTYLVQRLSILSPHFHVYVNLLGKFSVLDAINCKVVILQLILTNLHGVLTSEYEEINTFDAYAFYIIDFVKVEKGAALN